MEKPFAALFRGDLKHLVITENSKFIAFVESKPLVKGHVVVVAKAEVDAFFDLPESDLSELLVFARPIAQALSDLIICQKVGVAVLGLETRRAHLHLVPLQTADDLNFMRPKMQLSLEEASALTNQLKLKCSQ